MSKIAPHLWFDTQAVQASQLYLSLFPRSKLISHTVIKDTPSGDCDFLDIELAGQEFMLISAGPYFTLNPSISFLVACASKEEVDVYFAALIEGGNELMPLDSYDFSERYAWVIDRFGVSWQLMYTFLPVQQKITPTLMFVGENCGKAEEAVNFYASIFNEASVESVMHYGEDAFPDLPNSAQHIGFTLEGQRFAAMDSAYDHRFSFNEGISLLVYADTQEEIDRYWNALSAVPEAEQCGWLKDKYGLSWQISPRIMNEMMLDENEERLSAVTQCMLQMKKLDMDELRRVYDRYS
ncbi:MAG TPA: hypothetical protein DCP62_00550 [Erysipelotrichaceae bacterium]|nr:MAG: hypothetical protein A2Y19_05270 [Firmicutes bacterium GWE2_51_13]HAM62191.1 hypothetical protein [Erysipelotrichaceae bacterium]HBZ40877.1 hypothetical protein [Erysipelotrichaceae bacterium]